MDVYMDRKNDEEGRTKKRGRVNEWGGKDGRERKGEKGREERERERESQREPGARGSQGRGWARWMDDSSPKLAQHLLLRRLLNCVFP